MKLPLIAAAAALTAIAANAQPVATVLPWSETAVADVMTTPGRITDIMLEPGETLVQDGAVAAGDTARWIIGQTESGTGPQRRVHVLVKPTAVGLATNLLINTDRRTYRVELRSGPSAYLASVSWRYPPGELMALKMPLKASSSAPVATEAAPPTLERLSFGWRIEGRASWRPERVFDDGQRVVIDIPADARELPPLFEVAPTGGLRPLNYRVSGRRIIVDRLFDRGELRLREGKAAERVRLSRVAAP